MKIGIIGIGNMGRVLVSSLSQNKDIEIENIIINDIDKNKLSSIKKLKKVIVAKNNFELAKSSNIVVLAIKPQQLQNVLLEIKDAIDYKKLIVSIAAGIKIKYLESILGKDIPIIRCMPNLSLKIGYGLTAICNNQKATKKQVSFVKKIFSNKGKVLEFKEKYFDTVTAISGSGPAYIFYIANIMQEIAKQLSIENNKLSLLVNYTILGAAQFLVQTNIPAKELQNQVTSKGGTTESALKIFENFNLKKIFYKAILSAKKRSEELSRF